jgi:nucleoside 2-deoxyribosyltransferase
MTNVPLENKDKHMNNMINILKTLNDDLEYDIYSGLTHSAPINRNIHIIKDNKFLYEWYRNLISKSDIFMADVTYPSTGVGIELNIASNLNKPIYLMIDTYLSTQLLNQSPLSQTVHLSS